MHEGNKHLKPHKRWKDFPVWASNKANKQKKKEQRKKETF